MATGHAPASATVVVIGGDAVVGQALELLLKDANASVKFVPESLLEEPGSLSDATLLLLAPGLSVERREAILAPVKGESSAREIPVLELLTSAQTSRGGERHFVVQWPCRPEDLRRQIEIALLAYSRAIDRAIGVQIPVVGKEGGA